MSSADTLSCYFETLCAAGVSGVAQEPARLAERKAKISTELAALGTKNYKNFVEAAECSRSVFTEFSRLEEETAHLAEELPEVATRCSDFSRSVGDLAQRRHLNGLALQKYPQLLEILEIPQLMDTYVRNQYYEESLELMLIVRRLERKHTSLSLIRDIATEVRRSSGLMHDSLLAQLRTDLQLPACLKVVGFLRQLNTYSDLELRIKFLQNRTVWLSATLAAIPADDPYKHINKTIDLTRVHLFDIITQYKAVFSDDNPLLGVSTATQTMTEPSAKPRNIFHIWLTARVSAFLSTLEQDLSNGSLTTRMDTVLSQCMYFGQSFSRIHADIRPLMVPIFENAILATFSSKCDSALRQFVAGIREPRRAERRPAAASVDAFYAADAVAPPVQLLDFAPLVHCCNALVDGFNATRHCAPLTLRVRICTKLRDTVTDIARALRDRAARATSVERRVLEDMSRAFLTHLIPFAGALVTTLYPLAVTGAKEETTLDTTVAEEIIAELIPSV